MEENEVYVFSSDELWGDNDLDRYIANCRAAKARPRNKAKAMAGVERKETTSMKQLEFDFMQSRVIWQYNVRKAGWHLETVRWLRKPMSKAVAERKLLSMNARYGGNRSLTGNYKHA